MLTLFAGCLFWRGWEYDRVLSGVRWTLVQTNMLGHASSALTKSHTHSWRIYLGTHCARVHFHTELLRFVQKEWFSNSLSSLYRRVKDKYVKKKKKMLSYVSFGPFYSLNQQNKTFISPLRAHLSLSPFEQGLFFNITMGEERVDRYISGCEVLFLKYLKIFNHALRLLLSPNQKLPFILHAV